MRNKELIKLRVDLDLSQKEAAAKLNESRQNYNKIETGRSSGTIKFWRKFQKVFQMSNERMWGLINGEDQTNL